MTDLVVMSLEAWDGVWRRNQYLVDGLLRRDEELRVLFVEPAQDPLHSLLCGARPRVGKTLRPMGDPVYTGRLWAYGPTKILPRKLDPRLDARLAMGVVRMARRLGMRDPILWVNDPSGAQVLEATGWRALYDVTDDWVLANRPGPEQERLRRQESFLLAQVDEVVVCSSALQQSKGAAREVSLVPNGVDTIRYQTPAPRPQDLPDLPCAVYVGTVHHDRIDLELCIRTAAEVGEGGRLVLVGPAPLPQADRRALEEAGVLMLGPRPKESIPAYLQHADTLVVPHVVTPFTDSLDPIKAYEYRAVGRPVVTTPVAGFRESVDGHWYVRSGLDFARTVAELLPTRTPFPAGVQPTTDSWDDRVTAMLEVLTRLKSKRAPS